MIINIIILIWLHFVSDFLLQSDKMAINKSKSNKWLCLHVLIYSLPLLWFGWIFAAINGFLHFITDFITSRVTTKLYANHKHWFFVVIGLDQALHMSALILTLQYLEK